MSEVETLSDDPALQVLDNWGRRTASFARALGFLALYVLFLGVLTLFVGLALKLQSVTGADGRVSIAGVASNPTVATAVEATSILSGLLATAIICAKGRLSARDVGFSLSGINRAVWVGAGLGLSLMTAIVLLLIGLGRIQLAPFDVHGLEAPLWLTGFAILFGAVAVNEELLLRGPLLTMLSKAFGFWPAAIVTSLVFMALHVPNPGETPIGLANVVVVGLALAWSRRRTGSLWLAIGFHAAWDFAQSYLYGVPDSGSVFDGAVTRAAIIGPDWLSGGVTGPEGGVLTTLSMGWFVFVVSALWPKSRSASQVGAAM